MDNYSDNLDLWIWLSLICSPGSSIASDIIYYFNYKIEDVFNADSDEYSQIDGIKEQLVERLCNKNLTEAKEIRKYCDENGVGIMTAVSKMYPSRLRRLPDKPILLYYKGDPGIIDENVCIAVVGTRAMTDYGKRTAYSVSYDMAHGGAVLVSGMAKGIDGMAHRGCLDAGGKTVAILGCGIDRAYPSEHESLMKEIIENGIVMTEYKPGTPPNGYNFPIRNRIISGMAHGVLVVEAPKGSGALITAKKAITQGKKVYALPGKVGEMNSTGTNELIKNGASIITDAADILVEYQEMYPSKINLGRIPSMRSKKFKNPIEEMSSRKVAANPIPPSFFRNHDAKYNQSEKITKEVKASDESEQTDSEAKRAAIKNKADRLAGNNRTIYQALIGKSLTADQITSESGLSVSAVMASLTFLEVMGLVKALPGSFYTTI